MAAFGTVFMPEMALATFENDQWSAASSNTAMIAIECCIVSVMLQ